MIRRAISYLGSLRCTVLLISCLGVLLLTGFLLPQKSVLGKDLYLKWQATWPSLAKVDDFLHLTEIYTAPVTLAVWGLFFVNLALVMGQRIPLVIRRVTRADGPIPDPRTASFPFTATVVMDKGAVARLRSAVVAAGYAVRNDGGLFLGIKNRLSPLGTLLFHLSFFLILLGGALAFYSRFSGFVDLSEGEPFHGELARYNGKPRMPKAGGPPAVSFAVESIHPEVQEGVATGMQVVLRDDGGQRHVLEINRPYKKDHTSVLFNDLGVAPLFVIQDASGRELDGAYVKLNVLKGKPDRFTMMGYSIETTLDPQNLLGTDAGKAAVERLRGAPFQVAVRNQRGVIVASGILSSGQTLGFENYRLTFRELSLWVRLLVVKEYGLELVWAGFACGTLALIWRLFFYRRELVGALVEEDGKSVLLLGWKSEFYKNTAADEFNALVAALTRDSVRHDAGTLTEGAPK